MERSCGIKDIILRIKLQKMIMKWKKRVKNSKHRLNILKQWFQTQKSYIKDIELIKQNIQKPLLEAQLITQEQDRILFPNLDSMLALSHQILSKIQQSIKNWHPHKTMIGQDLINFHKGFIIYREYCNNYYKGEKIIKQAKRQKQCQKIQKKLPMDIQSYIIKPVQRPPKYQLLLRQYQKAIRQDHPDYPFLSIAIKKYHQVNEQNNQSMDEQIRYGRMADLDEKYGGIVSVTRNFLFEEIGKCIDFKVKLYVFNDLILVVKLLNDEREEGYKKIFLDARSFVEAPMDGKYFLNKIFICGQKQNIHLNFFSVNTRQDMYAKISKLIHALYRKQTNRHSYKKKIKIKMKVLKFQELKIKAQPQLRITVVGVEKRPMSALNNETVYILKIQAPFPCNVFQYSYVSLEQLKELQLLIKSRNRIVNLPLLDDNPESMSYYDIKKNKTKIIEYRQIYVQRFLNFIIRSEQLENQLQFIAKRLKINDQLWEVVSSAEPCTCDVCMSSNLLSFLDYQKEKSSMRSIRYSNQSSVLSNRNSVNSIGDISIGFPPGSCIFNSFLKTSKFIDTPVQQLDSLSRRLMWVDCKMGRIDYITLPKEQYPRFIKVGINFLSLKEEERTYVWINNETTVHEVIEGIAESYQISTLRDFGLFIDYQDFPRLIDRDEKLMEVIKNADIEFLIEVDQNKEKEKNRSFWQRVNHLKKWGGQLIGSKRTKIYLRKYIFVNDALQMKECELNPQRYSILIEEVFYRFKNQILITNKTDLKKLCALYYILTNIDRIPHLKQSNFQIQKLKALVPDSKWLLYTSFLDFERNIFFYIKDYWQMVEEHQQRKSNSKIFDKLQLIYNFIMQLVRDLIGWNTMFFDVANYDPPTLPGNQVNLLLGINRHKLIIIRRNQITPLLEIPILKLDYKVTVFSIFIQTSERILRFNGLMMYDIKKLIEIYRNLSEKFPDD